MATEVSSVSPLTEGNGHAEKSVEDAAAAVNNMKLDPPEVSPVTDSAADVPKLPQSSKDGVIKTPFGFPLETCKPTPRAALTAEQQQKYDTVLGKVSQWTEAPESLAKGAKMMPLSDGERMFLTRECILRYLRADKWNIAQAEKRLRDTISWRREYGVDKFTADYISVENETGKQVVLGYDNEGRPCQYLRPSKQNTEKSDRQIEHLVYMLERTIDLMPPGQDTLALLINFAETKAGQGATLAQGKQTMYILQNHYPERLGKALVTNVPFVIWGFFKLITPFIDPLTREKIKFNESMNLYVPKEQLMKESSGDVEFEYDHTSYWPALNKTCDARRAAYKARWERAGKRIGESEAYLRGGDAKSVAEEQSAADGEVKG